MPGHVCKAGNRTSCIIIIIIVVVVIIIIINSCVNLVGVTTIM